MGGSPNCQASNPVRGVFLRRLAFGAQWIHSLASDILRRITNQRAAPLPSKTLKKIAFFLGCAGIVAGGIFLFSAQAQARPAARRAPPPAPYAELVVEAGTGRILREENGLQTRHPASLTKMMTLYLTFQALESGELRLDEKIRVSRNATRQKPSKLGLQVGQTIRVHDAILALVTKSANDVSVVLAERLGGSVADFVRMMNEQARALGMRRTVFQNPSGLPDSRQVTTARDMATLALALVEHFPGFYPYFGQQSFTYNGQTLRNHNHLMGRYEGMDGIKTGYIQASGFNLVASAVRDNKRLIGIVFGGKKAASRDKQMEKILDEGFLLANDPARLRQRATRSLPLPTKVAAVFPPTGHGKRPAQTPQPALAQTKQEGPRAWGIQIGAFSDVSGAKQALLSASRSLRSSLAQAQPSLQKITMTDGTAVYRARFIGLEQKRAEGACAHLIQKGEGCLVFSGS